MIVSIILSMMDPVIIIPYVASCNGEIRAREWKDRITGDLRRYEGRVLRGSKTRQAMRWIDEYRLDKYKGDGRD
jgi:hypothetical protein